MRFNRIAALVTCTCLLATLFAVSPVMTVSAGTVAEYQSALEAAKSEANAIKAKISSLKAKNAPYEEQKAALEEQVSAVQKEINLYEQQIQTCKATIEARTQELADAKADLKRRLSIMYTSGNTELAVLLSADDYGDYLARSELAASVSRHDSKMISDTIDAIAELEEAQTALAAAEDEILVKKKELVSALDAVNQIVTANNKQVSALNSELAQKEKEQKEFAAAIEKAQKAQAAGSSTPGITGTGNFIWPVPGCYKVSSGFGARWGRTHSGIDIISSSGGVLGKTIVAADSGTVILSKYYSGYGNCIMIDHHNGYVTLYGHMRYLSSYGVGANVTKGATIGYVGATGNVTGPHLHFEIRVNGVCKNPMNWYN